MAAKEFDKFPKYLYIFESLYEIAKMWHFNTVTISIIIESLGIMKKV